MKILVPIKRVVDFNVKIRVKSDGSGIDLDNVKMSMNPFDEIAIEAALQLKEAGKAKEIIVVTIGVEKSQDVLRTGLAMGADRAILIQNDAPLEPLNVAKILSKIVTEESPDLLILGKQAIDDDANQTGQMLSALLGWSQATFASKIELENNIVRATREVDAGLQVIEVTLPAIITADLRLNTPRYATLPNVMKAKRKPLDTRQASEFNIDLSPRNNVLKVFEPAPRAAGIQVTSVDELVNKLKNEAGVI